MWKALTAVSLFLNVVALTCLGVIWFRWPFNVPSEKLLEEAKNNVDALNLALQLGRLDIISLLMAGFGLLLAFAFIGWMGLLRMEAKATVREIAENEAQARLDDFISNEAAGIIQGYMDLMQPQSEGDADELARVSGEKENG